jgi:2-haloacid dehalogenase
MSNDHQFSTDRRKFFTGLGAAALGAVAVSAGGAASPAHAQAVLDAVASSAPTGAVVPSVCVFDVNGSLLDVDSMAPFFQKVFGGDGIKMTRIWYDDLALYMNVIASSGSYPGSFIELGQAVLQMEASVYNAELRPAELEELKTQMLSMRLFPDVPDGLRMSKNAGFRLRRLQIPHPARKEANFSCRKQASLIYSNGTSIPPWCEPSRWLRQRITWWLMKWTFPRAHAV